MDRREMYPDMLEAIRVMFESMQGGLWTAGPGIVESVNWEAMTVQVQPAWQARETFPDGTYAYTPLPSLLDVPLHFLSGGGYTVTVPVQQGDEVLIVFASRCIDGWWQNGVDANKPAPIPPEIRFHSLSDGFAIPGIFSQPKVIGNISTTTAQVRSNDGQTFVDIDGVGQIVTITAPGGCMINAPVTTLSGTISVLNDQAQSNPCEINGNVAATGDVIAGFQTQNIRLLTHKHTGVQIGDGETGGPTQT